MAFLHTHSTKSFKYTLSIFVFFQSLGLKLLQIHVISAGIKPGHTKEHVSPRIRKLVPVFFPGP